MKKLWENTLFLSGVGLAVLVIVWGIAYAAVGNEYVLPSPCDTLQEAGKLLREASFYLAFFATLGRTLVAFFIALALGSGLAVLAYLCPGLEKGLRGVMAVLRALPTMAVLLLVLLASYRLLESYRLAPIIVGALTLFPLLYTATYSALCGVDKHLVEMSEIYRVPTKTRLTKLYLPAILPGWTREGLSFLSFGLKLVVSAEILAFTYRSLGGLLQEANISAEAAEMMAITMLVCLVGVALELVGAALFKRMGDRVCD